MSRLGRIIKSALLAFAGFFLLALTIALGEKLHTNALPRVASLQHEMLVVAVLCSGAAMVRPISWGWIRQMGLKRAASAISGAVALSILLLGGIAIAQAQRFAMTAVPENLSYDFLARRQPLQYTTWSRPTASAGVERWQIIQYGFPEPFLHVCTGISVDGQYIMLDKARLAFDWLLVLAGIQCVGTVVIIPGDQGPE